MKNKILLFIFISLFGASAIIEPISSAADFVTGATYVVHNNNADQVAGASRDANGNYLEAPSTSSQTDVTAGASTHGNSSSTTSDLTAGGSTSRSSRDDDDEYEDHEDEEDEYEDHEDEDREDYEVKTTLYYRHDDDDKNDD